MPRPIPASLAGVRLVVAGTLVAGCVSGVGVAAALGSEATTCLGTQPTILGTSGDDHLVGTDRHDVIVGFGGDDTIVAGDGRDRLCGGPGGDRVLGERGLDRIAGGRGHDVLDGGDADGKQDILTYRLAPQPVTMMLEVGRVVGVGDDAVTGFEQVRGSAYADWIHGSSGDEYVYGARGADWIHGGGGFDIIRDGFGAYSDVLRAGVDGGQLLAAGGDDQLFAGRDGAGTEAQGGFGDDTLVGYGGADYLSGDYGSDILVGGGGQDTLVVQVDAPEDADDELVRAGAGSDRVFFNLLFAEERRFDGSVAIMLGAGDDQAFAPVVSHLSIRGSSGMDGVDITDSRDVSVDLAAGTVAAPFEDGIVQGRLHGLERVATLSGDDSIVGTDLAETFVSGDGADEISAGGGDDTVDGGDGVDRADGGSGHDTCTNVEDARNCEG